MKLSDTFKELIKESSGHDYGCVMIYLPIEEVVWKNIRQIKEEDVYEPEGDRSYGIQPYNEAHVTILYGLHSDIPDETIEELVKKMTAPEVTLKNITLFQNENFDVVKFDVEGEELHKMNKMFTELPHTTDYPDYHPHCTIAYVKPGCGKSYESSLDEPITIKPHKIVYSKADGSKKEYKL